jgi:hypothetical protein
VGAAAVFMRSNLDGAATVAGVKATTFPVWHGTDGRVRRPVAGGIKCQILVLVNMRAQTSQFLLEYKPPFLTKCCYSSKRSVVN